MTAFYNEIDPYASQWLKNLIAAGHIAPGVVDTRSISEIEPYDLREFTQCHFFAGIGVWSHALRLSGWADERPVWTGSCPCQPFSVAGRSGGFTDERHLWPHWHHLIRECRPEVVFGEQVASKDGLAWLDLVQADLEGEGYAATAVDICAAGVGAPHIRQRIYFVGHTEHAGLEGHAGAENARHRPGRFNTDADRSDAAASVSGAGRPTNGFWREADWLLCKDGKRRPVEPGTFPLGDGTPDRVGRLRAYGNAIVPQVAAEVIKAFLEVRP